MPLIDHHCHTQFSPDSSETPARYADAARLFGLDGFVITDHVDMPDWEMPGYSRDPHRAESFAILSETRERYPDLYIGFGMELGNELFDRQRAAASLADDNLDFVIGSAHTLADGRDFYVLRYKSEEDCHGYLRLYCEELVTLCRECDFDVLGHLTYPLRYMKTAGFTPDFTMYRDAVAESFKILIDRGKGIECNASGLRQPIGVTLPDEFWLRLFHDLGGKVVTLGSDAHRAQDLGSGLEAARQLLQHCGFGRYSVFRKRVAQFEKL